MILDLLSTMVKSVQRGVDRGKLNAKCCPLNTTILNCRVQLTKQKRGDTIFDAFTVEIAGSIHAAGDDDYATVQILIADVTDGTHKAKPVNVRSIRGQTQDMPQAFCYRADLGRLPNRVTTLSDWTTVAHLNTDGLLFPHKGKRVLRFSTSVISSQSSQEIAHAECFFAYENPAFGYIDLQENVHRTKSLAVALAFAVSAADSKMYHAEIQTVKQWAIANLLPSGAISTRLEGALDYTVSFFQRGNQLDIYKVCKEIVEIALLSERYEILDLCLRVARAKGNSSRRRIDNLERHSDLARS
jgi:hypothetical protein